MDKNVVASMRKSAKAIYSSIPMLSGIIFLIGLLNALVPPSAYIALFSKNALLDAFIGSGVGSFLAGNPVTSYVLGGEMYKQGISLIAVTAFLVAWVSVGLIQLPFESQILGKRFALTRNVISFLFSIIAAIMTTLILGLL